MVALNQRNEVVSKVSRQGMDALTEEERAMLPLNMDMTDEAYRRRLRGIFGQHAPGGAFTNFHLAQVVWDETMARSIAEYLGENPGRKMVVITGQGHTAWRSGIPERVRRQTGLDYALVVQNEEGALSPEKADYVLFADEMPAPVFPVIGVKLRRLENGFYIF